MSLAFERSRAVALLVLVLSVRLGSFEVSDLHMAWFDAAGNGDVLQTEQVPESATLLHVGVELSLAEGVTTTPPAYAAFTIVGVSGGEPVSQGESELEPHETSWRAGVQIPVAKLPPGAYDVTMTLVERGKPVGSLSRRIRILSRAIGTASAAYPWRFLTRRDVDAGTRPRPPQIMSTS